jgi:hypothetical protein
VRPTKVAWSEGRTIKLGDFNMAKINFGIDADLDEDETPEEAQAKLRKIVRGLIEEECGAILERRSELLKKKT